MLTTESIYQPLSRVPRNPTRMANGEGGVTRGPTRRSRKAGRCESEGDRA